MKKPGLSAIAPPSRERAPIAATSATSAEALTMKSFRLRNDTARELKMLAASTGKKEYELVEEALALLFASAGRA